MKMTGLWAKITLFAFFIFSPVVFANQCLDNTNTMAWIWPNAHKELKNLQSETVYILQASFHKENQTFIFRGSAPHKLEHKKLVLVFRLDSLPDSRMLAKTFQRRASEWKRQGVEVVGMQLDFDSPTLKLNTYADYLLKVKKELPLDFNLSITGLADWINHSEDFKSKLKESNIAIFYQIYQGRIPHKDGEKQILDLYSYNHPFAVGLLPTQKISPNILSELNKNKFFKGILCFYGEKI